ncbi:MAG: hypothetical protein ACE5HX_17760, partial [bacterium]
MKHLTQLLVVLLLTTVIMGCGNQLKLNSNWQSKEIAIDGDHEDWQDAMTFVEKKNVSVGIANDAEFLY